MADQAATVVDPLIHARVRRRSLVWAVAPVAALVAVDLVFSVLVFVC